LLPKFLYKLHFSLLAVWLGLLVTQVSLQTSFFFIGSVARVTCYPSFFTKHLKN